MIGYAIRHRRGVGAIRRSHPNPWPCLETRTLTDKLAGGSRLLSADPDPPWLRGAATGERE